MKDVEEKPLHEVILDIMFFKNKEKPVPYSPEDIFWQIKDPSISERQIKEVLDWLVVNKRVEKRFGKYQIDKYEFIDIANRYNSGKDENVENKTQKNITKVEVVKKVSVSSKQPKKQQKNSRKNIKFKWVNTLLILICLPLFAYMVYTLYSPPKNVVAEIKITEELQQDIPGNLYVSTDKIENREFKSKIKEISYSFVKQNRINNDIVNNVNRINNEIVILQKGLDVLNKSYEESKEREKILFRGFLGISLLFIVLFVLFIKREYFD